MAEDLDFNVYWQWRTGKICVFALPGHLSQEISQTPFIQSDLLWAFGTEQVDCTINQAFTDFTPSLQMECTELILPVWGCKSTNSLHPKHFRRCFQFFSPFLYCPHENSVRTEQLPRNFQATLEFYTDPKYIWWILELFGIPKTTIEELQRPWNNSTYIVSFVTCHICFSNITLVQLCVAFASEHAARTIKAFEMVVHLYYSF